MKKYFAKNLLALLLTAALLAMPMAGVAEEVSGIEVVIDEGEKETVSEVENDGEEESVGEVGDVPLFEVNGMGQAEEDQDGARGETADDEHYPGLYAEGTQANESCSHEYLYLDTGDGTGRNGLTVKDISYKPNGKYQHITTKALSGKYYVRCEDCDQIIATANLPGTIYMQEKGLCDFHFFTKHKKCGSCKQGKSTCKHKSYRVTEKLYGYEDLNMDNDCLYFDSNRHVTRVLVGGLVQEADEEDEAEEMRTRFYICKTCGAFATEVTFGGERDVYWWTGYPESMYETSIEVECDVKYEFQKHNYVNGICTGCGHIKSLPTVKLTSSNLTLAVKEKATLPSEAVPSGVSFTSSNKKIATVNAKTGVVTAKKKGTATIKATYNNIELATCKVTVKNAPGKVTLNKKKLTVNAGNTFQLKAKLPSGTYTSKYTWTSNKTSVATVDKNGLVTGVKTGTAKITVKTGNGKTATCTVTVKAAMVSKN